MSYADEFFIWLLGRPLCRPRAVVAPTGYVFLHRPPALWESAPFGDYHAITVSLPKAPNAFHRGMQRLCFGIRYRRVRLP